MKPKKFTSARVTHSAVDTIQNIHQKMSDKKMNIKKFELWDEAARLLEQSVLNKQGELK